MPFETWDKPVVVDDIPRFPKWDESDDYWLYTSSDTIPVIYWFDNTHYVVFHPVAFDPPSTSVKIHVVEFWDATDPISHVLTSYQTFTLPFSISGSQIEPKASIVETSVANKVFVFVGAYHATSVAWETTGRCAGYYIEANGTVTFAGTDSVVNAAIATEFETITSGATGQMRWQANNLLKTSTDDVFVNAFPVQLNAGSSSKYIVVTHTLSTSPGDNTFSIIESRTTTGANYDSMNGSRLRDSPSVSFLLDGSDCYLVTHFDTVSTDPRTHFVDKFSVSEVGVLSGYSQLKNNNVTNTLADDRPDIMFLTTGSWMSVGGFSNDFKKVGSELIFAIYLETSHDTFTPSPDPLPYGRPNPTGEYWEATAAVFLKLNTSTLVQSIMGFEQNSLDPIPPEIVSNPWFYHDSLTNVIFDGDYAYVAGMQAIDGYDASSNYVETAGPMWMSRVYIGDGSGLVPQGGAEQTHWRPNWSYINAPPLDGNSEAIIPFFASGTGQRNIDLDRGLVWLGHARDSDWSNEWTLTISMGLGEILIVPSLRLLQRDDDNEFGSSRIERVQVSSAQKSGRIPGPNAYW